jgi:uncharacterized protein YdhG (YjbR/CyaY superfamily)
VNTHDDYFASAATDVRPLLESIQTTVETLVPGCTRCISYRMPAFRGKKVFFYFAAFKKHIGIYPPVQHNATLIKQLAPYRNEKGNLAFPLNEALPLALIGKVAVALAKEYA